MTTASIDDLLRYDEEPPDRPAPAPTTARWLIQMLLLAVAATALVVVALRLNGLTAPYALVFSGVMALLLLRRILSQLPRPVRPRLVGRRFAMDIDPAGRRVGDSILLAIARWENRLDWSKTDHDRFVRIIQGPVTDMVDERLRQRHGLTRTSDPQRSRAITGEALWQFLITPADRTPTPRELAALLTAIERI